MAVRVLGPLDIGESHLSPRERAVLAALVVRRGSALAPEDLAEAYWGESVPATWGQQVRTSIARIRRGLGADAVDTIAGEYLLRVDPNSIDAVRFEQLVSSARGHAALREHDRASDEYRRALALWRGTPFIEVDHWYPGAVEAARLTEIRRSAEEEFLETRLASGDHRAAIAQAEQLVSEQPLREDRWAILALATYRCDRQADALAVLRAARRRLRDELAIEPGERITALETAILHQDPALAPPPEPGHVAERAPYPGLQPFGPQDADEFFGREDDIGAVVQRVAPGKVVVIAGPSGSGKSSLLLAGVLPQLAASQRSIRMVRSAQADLAALFADPDPVDVLAIDQAEEMFSKGADELDGIGRAAARFVQGGASLMLTLRSDFLDAAARLPELGALISRGVYVLGPLGPAALREAIEKPAQRAGVQLEAGLVELLLRDAGSSADVLPHLSHALVATWERREGRTLTVSGYEDSGGITGAVTRSAEDFFHELDASGREACRTIMLRLVDLTPDGAPLRRRISTAVLAEDPCRAEVLERLVTARLVTADGDTVAIAHEAVARAWPRLAGWLADDAESARVWRSVETAATAWEQEGRPDDDLLRGARLQTALEWRASRDPDLSRTEADFLDVAADRATATEREVTLRARRDRRQNQRLRWTLGGAVIALVAVVVAGGLAASQARRAAEASSDARIEALTATVLALRESDADVAALLAVEAYRRWPDDPRSRSALLGVMTAAGGLVGTTFIPDADEAASTLIPGTRSALVARDRRGAVAWATDLVTVDIDTGAVLRTYRDVVLPGQEGAISRDVHVSDDGGIGLVQTWLPRGDGCCVSRLDFVDLRSGRGLAGSQTLDARTGLVVALGEKGAQAYLVNSVTGGLISVDTGTAEVRMSKPVDPDTTQDVDAVTNALAIIDRDRVAIGSTEGVTVFDRNTLAPLQRIPLGSSDAAGSSLVPDGTGGLLVVGSDGLRRLDLATGRVLWHRVPDRANGYGVVAPDAGRGTFMAADFDGHLDEFRLESGEPTGRVLTSRQGQFGIPYLLDDGRELVFLDLFSPLVVRWRLDGGGPVETLVAPGLNTVGGFGVDGTMLLVQDVQRAGPVRLWDIASDKPAGVSASGLEWMSDVTLLRHDEEDRVDVVDARTGASHGVRDTDQPVAADDVRLVRSPGATTPFSFFPDHLVAYDLESRTEAGQRLELPKAARNTHLASLSQAGSRLVATFSTDGSTAESLSAVWNVDTGELLATGLRGDARTIAAGDGVISAGLRRLVRADLDTLEVSASLARPDSEAQRIQTGGLLLMVATYDQRVWLYDLASGVRLGEAIPAGPTRSEPAYLRPDGGELAVNGREGVILWDLDPAHQAAAACRIAGRNLSPEEWATYLGERGDYRRTCS